MINLTHYFSTLPFVLIVMAGGILGNYCRDNAVRQPVGADALR